jgi:hypothetical protein
MGRGSRTPAPDPAPAPTAVIPDPAPPIEPDPYEPARDILRVNVDEMSGFSGASKTKLLTAVDLMERVLSSEQFRQAVLGHQYEGKRQFVQNSRSDAEGNDIGSNLTNAQIYQILMEGAEQLKGIAAHVDRVANVNLNLYTPPFYKKWSVVGYTNPGVAPIYMNSYYFNSFTPGQIAANISHEWTHKIGFDHDYNSTTRRPYSVPYGIGGIVERVASALTGEE